MISVIMSVKDGANELHRSIDSILNQTYSDFEFIICDDGSSDNSLNVLNNYALKDDRIQIIHNNISKGLAYSLNRCIELSRSNILARQDADDVSALNRFELQYPFIIKHPEYAIVGTSWYNVDSGGNILKEEHPQEIPSAKDQVCGGSYMHPSWMMRKDSLKKVGFYTVNKYTIRDQDYHLVMKVLAAGMKLYNMPDFLYYYTTDENTMKRSLNWFRVKGLMWIRYDSYRRNHLPFWYYIFVLKPLLVHLIPPSIMMWYYKKKYAK